MDTPHGGDGLIHGWLEAHPLDARVAMLEGVRLVRVLPREVVVPRKASEVAEEIGQSHIAREELNDNWEMEGVGGGGEGGGRGGVGGR